MIEANIKIEAKRTRWRHQQDVLRCVSVELEKNPSIERVVMWCVIAKQNKAMQAVWMDWSSILTHWWNNPFTDDLWTTVQKKTETSFDKIINESSMRNGFLLFRSNPKQKECRRILHQQWQQITWRQVRHRCQLPPRRYRHRSQQQQMFTTIISFFKRLLVKLLLELSLGLQYLSQVIM